MIRHALSGMVLATCLFATPSLAQTTAQSAIANGECANAINARGNAIVNIRQVCNRSGMTKQAQRKFDRYVKQVQRNTKKIKHHTREIREHEREIARHEGRIDVLESELGDGYSRIRVDAWRDRYRMGSVSGHASFSLVLNEATREGPLKSWLARVQKRYKKLRRSRKRNEVELLGLRGQTLRINLYTKRGNNADLVPDRDGEELASEAFFRGRFIMLTTGGTKRGLLLPTLRFDAELRSVEVTFDPETNKPIRVASSLSGDGIFSPIAGQFTNWMDYYGATLIVRRIGVSEAVSTIIDAVEYDYVRFSAKDELWSKSAKFAIDTGAELYTDDKNSLIIQNADWQTLGKLPADFPGQRLEVHGPPPKPW